MQDLLDLRSDQVPLVCLLALPWILLSLVIPYVAVRLRDDTMTDAQLGIKIGLQFFYSLAILVWLGGLTLLLVGGLWLHGDSYGREMAYDEMEGPSATQRTGAGLALAGLIFALLYRLLIWGMTDAANWPRVRRAFLGWRFVLHGLVVLFAGTALLVRMAQDEYDRMMHHAGITALFGVLAIWLPSWLIHLALLQWSVRKPRQAAPPDTSKAVSPVPGATLAVPAVDEPKK